MKKELFESFLGELAQANPEHTDLLEAIQEGFAVFEGPYIWNNKQAETPRSMRSDVASSETEEDIADKNAEAERLEKTTKRRANLLKGVKAQILKAAVKMPLEIEEFIKGEDVLSAIKQGKKELDEQFGTETSKKSLWDRTKSAAKAFTESIEDGEKWASIVYLSGDEAQEVFNIIDEEGEDAGARYLSGWDYGHESENDLSEGEPWGSRDFRFVSNIDGMNYVVAGNKHLDYISLNRKVKDEE
jgi:hypothetical protein